MPGCRHWNEIGPVPMLNRDSPQAQGLSLWWPLRDRDASTSADLGGYNKYLTLQAAGMRTVGSFGRGLQFNGSSQYASSVALDLSFALSRGVTLSAWVSTTSGYNAILVAASASGGSHLGLYAGWTGLDAASENKVAAGFHHSTTWTDQYTYGTTSLNDGVLRHLAATYDAVTNEINVYVNGIVEASNTLGLTPAAFTGAEPVSVGRYPLAAVEYLTGYAYDPRVYARSLDAAEIMAIYAPQTRYDLYWRQRRSAAKQVVAAPAGGLRWRLAGSRPSLAGVGGLAG